MLSRRILRTKTAAHLSPWECHLSHPIVCVCGGTMRFTIDPQETCLSVYIYRRNAKALKVSFANHLEILFQTSRFSLLWYLPSRISLNPPREAFARGSCRNGKEDVRDGIFLQGQMLMPIVRFLTHALDHN